MDGSVHHHTFTQKKGNRGHLISENSAVADLGFVVYDALDYSLPKDQQRTLSTDLEDLIEKMTSAEDEEENITGLCSHILKLFRLHHDAKQKADKHYKSVCRLTVQHC